ncbi:nitroreductase [Balneicella halophila]|uniref:Nitroreductase n=1 Tax=Balneicella halophila TaxID=1537566 RepID=A0A7L4UNT1_BALHA|nr:nitroreductase family protein [Balneicella halophila]PVX50748.1 nitroreductase [Balneicella halophila]
MFIYKYISRDTKEFVKRKLNSLSIFKYRIVSFSPILAKVYYFFNSKISSELYNVTNGIYLNKVSNFNQGRFRRNIHRIEKGLIMRPRRETFALGYMNTVLDDYKYIVKKFNNEEVKWSTSVLDEFFRVCSGKEIDKLKSKYLTVRLKDATEDMWVNCKNPYLYKDKDISVSPQELLELCQVRSSVRWYINKVVEKQDIEDAIEVAKTAPSACNRQPFRFISTNNRDLILRVGGLAPGTSGFLENIPNLICVVGDLKNYEFEKDRHIIYIDSSLAVMQMLLFFQTKGISSCILNWPEEYKRDKAISKLLNLEKSERVVLLVAFGYADKTGSIPFSAKKGNNEMLEII